MSGEQAAVVVRDRQETGITFRQATDCAGMCKAIVTETAIRIQGRKYVRVEGWQAIAVAHGCVASARDVERIEGGVKAIGEVKRGTDGMVLATAEGFVGDDESIWGKRDEYAKRAMAQTRAISRACRSAFAHVVVMMNAGLETTPAEEVPEGGFADRRPHAEERHSTPTPPRQLPPPTQQPPKAKATPPEQPPHHDADAEGILYADVVLGEVRQKSGEGKRGPWTRFYAKADDGQYYSTFDTTLAGQMKDLADLGDPVVIGYRIETSPKGENRTVVSVAGAVPPDAAQDDPPPARTAEQAADDDRKGQREMPF